MKSVIVIIVSICFFNCVVFGLSQTQSIPSSFSTSNANGGTFNWTNSLNVSSSNNIYSYSGDLSSNGDLTYYLQVTNFGFSIPAGAVIDGIVVEIEKYSDNVKAKDNEVKIIQNSIITGSNQKNNSGWPSSDTYISYGAGTTDLWGVVWVVADINSSNFGIAISVSRVGGGSGACNVYIDHVSITVYYTPNLPISLIQFNCQVTKELKVLLNWSTASEINNNYFSIERRLNLENNFESIGIVKGSGNSYNIINYEFLDNDIIIEEKEKFYYYRLKQVDYDGKFEYSKIINAHIRNNLNERDFIVTVYDILGREILIGIKIRMNIKDDNNTNIVNEILKHNIKKGFYIISAQSDSFVFNKKIVID